MAQENKQVSPPPPKKKKPLIMWQPPMINVLYALVPIIIYSVYLYGWRSLAMIVLLNAAGFGVEYLFVRRDTNQVTSAVFVTATLLALSLPPSLPLWMGIAGVVFAVTFGKMVFGGFGKNVFNPALTGRAFLYVSFGMFMTNKWVNPLKGLLGGFLSWNSADAVTGATPLDVMKHGEAVNVLQAFLGRIPGSMGETSALLIILGGTFIIWKKAANYRIVASGIIGMLAMQTILWLNKVPSAGSPIEALVCGGFLFGIFFFATDPISASQTDTGRWLYGGFIGVVSVIIRVFSAWPEGIMFAILLGNIFAPITDYYVREFQAKRKAAKGAKS